jgi:predicted PurR-regulated permease PerM
VPGVACLALRTIVVGRRGRHLDGHVNRGHAGLSERTPAPAILLTVSERMSPPDLSFQPQSEAEEYVAPDLNGASDERPEPIHLPSNPVVILQAAQFALLFMAALYVTRPIVLPIVLAILLKLLMQPGVRKLERWHVPRSVAALTMIVALFVLFVSMGAALSGPAHAWSQKLPDGLPRLQERLNFISGPVVSVQRFLNNAESYMHLVSSQGGIPTAAPSSGLSDLLVSGTASFASGLFITIVVLFFLLVSGDLFLRRFVEILPRFRDKKTAVMISQHIESDIAAYLMTVTVMNASVGVATSLATWATGLDDPVLWGVLAFFLNYIPVIGPIICLFVLLMAGLLTIEPLWASLLPAAAFLALHVTEGQFITPFLVARRFTLNPVLVIVSLIFWYWMWGVPGAILAVPVLGMVKIICDGIRPWAALGHLIEG